MKLVNAERLTSIFFWLMIGGIASVPTSAMIMVALNFPKASAPLAFLPMLICFGLVAIVACKEMKNRKPETDTTQAKNEKNKVR